jgi:lipid-binding SYLF domain-containing protein
MPGDAEMPALTQALRRAQAVFIAPSIVKGGFFFGGEGGAGVLVSRLPDGGWSAPAFFDVAAGSLGLQFGGQVSRTVIAIMTDRGLEAILSSRFTLGAEMEIAMVDLGAGVGARTGMDWNADMYTFTQNDGLFIGGALEGSVLLEDGDAALSYYGTAATARQILAGQIWSPHAERLRAALPAPLPATGAAPAAAPAVPTANAAPAGTVTVETLN